MLRIGLHFVFASAFVVLGALECAAQSRIVHSGEFFFDTDPGFGAGSAFNATDGSFDEVFEAASAPASSLSVGLHTLHVRMRDASGNWSPTFRTVVSVEAPSVPLRNVAITQAEYFWDTDPGQGSATPLLAFDGAFDEAFEQAFALAQSVPPLGLRTLNVRMLGTDGTWSTTFRTVVSVEAPSVPLRAVAITQAEYFWDSDPGQGSATPLLAFDGAFDEAFEQAFALAQSVPPLGLHTLNVRMLGSDGVWSTAFRTVVSVEAPSVPIRSVSVAQAEYFWDTDPGPGNAMAFAAGDGTFEEAFEQALASSNTLFLGEGPHVLGVRVQDANGNWSPDFRSVVHLEADPSFVHVAVKLMLHGPYSSTSGLMSDALRTAQLLPLAEPYTALGYSFVGGGTENTVQPVLGQSGNNAIVDWVVLELRDPTTPSTVIASRSALLQRDGDVVDVNGTSSVAFSVAPGNYHVAVRHRNHLGAMTLTPVTMSTTAINIDLTQSSTPTFGTDARKSVTGAFPAQVLWAGDVTFNGVIKYTGAANDRDPILQAIGGAIPTNTVSGYLQQDVNMDGSAKYTGGSNDRDPILQNIGGAVPTNSRTEQLP